MSNSKKPKHVSKGLTTAGQITGHIMRLLATIFLICVITGCIVVTAITIYVMNFMETDNGVNLDNINLSFTTMIYADDPNQGIVELHRMSGDQNRIEVTLDQIPQHVQDAFICTEDKRFFDHEGVDWVRTIRVSIGAVFNGESAGGSTITQQLIKNATKDDDVTPVRKLREIFRALELERSNTKAEILESYLNIMFLGGRVYGVEAAAQYYFGCHVWELTVPQACSLAGMTRSPNNRRPDLYPEKNKDRRDYSLQMMYEQGKITKTEYEKYLATPVVATGSGQVENGTISSSNGVTSYFVDAVIEDAIVALMDKYEWTRQYAYDRLKNGGYRVYTTVDLELQTYLDGKFQDWSTFSKKEIKPNKDGDIPQGAFVLMNYEGHILAMAGGKGEKTESLSFNRATMAKRPPGSTIKPLAVYAPCLEYDFINWSTILNDSPAMKLNGKDWPSNYEKKYTGNMTVQYAVEKSRNTIPVKLMQQLTNERSITFLEKKFGISTLVKTGSNNDFGLSLAIGSMSDGLLLDEMVAAFAPFGNGGNYFTPVTFTRIEDANGNVILDNEPKKTRAMSEDTASVMNRLLRDVVRYGTGKEARLGDMPVVGKTGTTSDYYDLSFVGLTPYYLGGFWTGYDTPSELPWQSIYDPDTVWANIMGPLHEDLEVKDFTLSENMVQLEYCKISGLAATAACTQKAMGYYKTNAKPEPCDEVHGGTEEESESGGGASGTPGGPGDGPPDAIIIN